MANFSNDAFEALKRALLLDKNDLDRQLCEHAELFYQVCEMLAYLEDDYKLLEAEVDRRIRDEIAADPKAKVTETEIKRIMAFDAKLGPLKLKVDRVKGLKDAYIERRHAFGKLADLYGNQYWSEHSGVSRRTSKAAGDAARERVKETIRRNKL